MKRLATLGALLLVSLACNRNKAQKSNAERDDKSGAAAETEQTPTDDNADETEAEEE